MSISHTHTSKGRSDCFLYFLLLCAVLQLFLLYGFIHWLVCHCLMSALPLTSLDGLKTCAWRPA